MKKQEINKSDSLGIPNYGLWYLETLPNQIGVEEMAKIHGFLKNIAVSDRVPEFQGKSKRLQFINYGRTQLVYVLTIDENRQYTILVTQPAAQSGVGKREFQNLNNLSQKNDLVIKPLYYFQDENEPKRELYITPYYYQSRCIGVESKDWGMWVPEPVYHFKEYSDKERSIINLAMVASLVSLYDDKKKKGLSKCRLDGGDFMLEKGFEKESLSAKNILKRIKLIAARDLVEMNLDDYIEQMKKELMGNMGKEEKNIILGKKIKCPMTKEEVEQGIELGLELRSRENQIHK